MVRQIGSRKWMVLEIAFSTIMSKYFEPICIYMQQKLPTIFHPCTSQLILEFIFQTFCIEIFSLLAEFSLAFLCK